jgi:hypothetical protein
MSLRTRVHISLLLLAASLPACDWLFNYKDDPNYCPDRPNNNCLNNGTASCQADQECSGGTPVCDLTGTMSCVQCTAERHSACTGATPVCGEDQSCQGCTSHAQCLASNACLPDGSCADAGQVAYVEPAGTDNASCTRAMPCTLVGKALATNRPYVKFAGTTDEVVTIDNGRIVTFLAEPGAKLTRTIGTGAIVTVRDNGTSLTVYDLSISDAPNNPSGIGIVVPTAAGAPTVTLNRAKLTNNPGGGISASGGILTVSQSTVSGNTGGGITSGGALTVSRSTISGNPGGGISISGAGATFNITNSYVVRNGDELMGTFGGLSLGIGAPGNNRLEFNTIVDNKAAVNSAGVVCNVPAFMAPNNIVARNNRAGSTTAPGAQTTIGGCTYPSSKVQNDVAGLMFERPDPPGMLSYKLLPGSTALDQATTPSEIAVDHDGEPRTSGGGKDIGADELQR